jgi:hypothetical protein
MMSGDDIELDLQLLPQSEEGPGRVAGQVITRTVSAGTFAGASGARVEIVDDRGTRAATDTDCLGVFSITGDWQLPLVITVDTGGGRHEAYVPNDVEPEI